MATRAVDGTDGVGGGLNFEVSLDAGDTVDFVLLPNANFNYDASVYTATIKPKFGRFAATFR